MVDDNRPLVDSFDNVDWLNAIRNEAGIDYQSRIPEATQANIQDVISSLWTYKPLMNQFVDVLVNRIGLVLFQEWSWSNPLAPLKRGMLNWGETIEEIMVGLVEADEYDFDRDELEGELFGSKKPEVQASYHTVNRRNRYKITVREPALRNAFIEPGGLSKFIANLMASLTKSDQVDEYYAMANLFREMDRAALKGDGSGNGLYNVNIADIADEESTPEQSKYALRRLREFSSTLQFPSRLYNPAGMPQAVNPDDLILFTTPGADAAIDVEALAGAFNIDRANVKYRKFVLPYEHYGIPGFQAALTTKEFFVVADQRIDTTSMNNPAALLTNYWLHHWQVISASRFAPIVMFNSIRPSTTLSTVEYEVTGISDFTITDESGAVQATNVERGNLYDVAVSAETTPVGGPGAVRLSIDNKSSAFTKITNNGVLYVAPDETVSPLVIRATAVNDDGVPQASETTSRTVIGTLVNPWPNPSVNDDSDSDGLNEATPVAPNWNDPVVTIPSVTGIQYKKAGTAVPNGSKHTLAASTVFTAEARAGYEIPTTATKSWTFAPA